MIRSAEFLNGGANLAPLNRRGRCATAAPNDCPRGVDWHLAATFAILL